MCVMLPSYAMWFDAMRCAAVSVSIFRAQGGGMFGSPLQWPPPPHNMSPGQSKRSVRPHHRHLVVDYVWSLAAVPCPSPFTLAKKRQGLAEPLFFFWCKKLPSFQRGAALVGWSLRFLVACASEQTTPPPRRRVTSSDHPPLHRTAVAWSHQPTQTALPIHQQCLTLSYRCTTRSLARCGVACSLLVRPPKMKRLGVPSAGRIP